MEDTRDMLTNTVLAHVPVIHFNFKTYLGYFRSENVGDVILVPPLRAVLLLVRHLGGYGLVTPG